MILFALLLILAMTVGHFLYGIFVYLKTTKKLLGSDTLTAYTNEAVFHYSSVMFGLSFMYVLGAALKIWEINRTLSVFIGLWCIGSGIVNFYYATRPQVGLFKMFHWILFILTGIVLLIA